MKWKHKLLDPEYIPKAWDAFLESRGFVVGRRGNRSGQGSVGDMLAINPETGRRLKIEVFEYGRASWWWSVAWLEEARSDSWLAHRNYRSTQEVALAVEEWVWCEENWARLLNENATALKELTLAHGGDSITLPKRLDLDGHPFYEHRKRQRVVGIYYNRHIKKPWSVAGFGQRQYRKTFSGAVSALKKKIA